MTSAEVWYEARQSVHVESVDPASATSGILMETVIEAVFNTYAEVMPKVCGWDDLLSSLINPLSPLKWCKKAA